MTIICLTRDCYQEVVPGQLNCKECLKKLYAIAEVIPDTSILKQPEYTGKASSYYEVEITNPRRGGEGYLAECGDIIEALGMDFNEGTAFKAIWRKAAARTLGKTKKGNNALYDAEKVQFYGERMVAIEQARNQKAR